MENFSMYLIVMVYFLSIAFLGYLGYKKTKDSKDFLIGGGEMNPIVMALSYGATFISASAIVGFGGVRTFRKFKSVSYVLHGLVGSFGV